MSEIVFASSDAQESRRISRRVKAGELRVLRPRVYTSNLTDEPEQIVRRNFALILGQLYPDALISHRSALEGGSLAGPDIYLTYLYTKKVPWPGVVIMGWTWGDHSKGRRQAKSCLKRISTKTASCVTAVMISCVMGSSVKRKGNKVCQTASCPSICVNTSAARSVRKAA